MNKKFLLIHDNSIMAVSDELEGEVLQTLCDEAALQICLHPGATLAETGQPASVADISELVGFGATWITLAWEEDGESKTDVFHIETLELY